MTTDPAEVETEIRRLANERKASSFDRLAEITLSLTTSVNRLVKISWAIIILNVALISAVVIALVWAVFTLSGRAS